MDTPKVLSDGLDKVKVRTKVDGEEGEVSIDEMLREYQKGKTADRRLADLSRRQRELDEREAQLRAQVAPVATPPTRRLPRSKSTRHSTTNLPARSSQAMAKRRTKRSPMQSAGPCNRKSPGDAATPSPTRRPSHNKSNSNS
jgi:phage/plasmid primase-like uncharacterized protein